MNGPEHLPVVHPGWCRPSCCVFPRGVEGTHLGAAHAVVPDGGRGSVVARLAQTLDESTHPVGVRLEVVEVRPPGVVSATLADWLRNDDTGDLVVDVAVTADLAAGQAGTLAATLAALAAEAEELNRRAAR